MLVYCYLSQFSSNKRRAVDARGRRLLIFLAQGAAFI